MVGVGIGIAAGAAVDAGVGVATYELTSGPKTAEGALIAGGFGALGGALGGVGGLGQASWSIAARVATKAASSAVVAASEPAALLADKGRAAALRVGQAGEKAVADSYSFGLKTAISINGRNRILDGLNDEAVSEVKNVAKLSNTRKVRTYTDYASDNGLRLDLYVRESTKISGPLNDLHLDPLSPVNIIRFLP